MSIQATERTITDPLLDSRDAGWLASLRRSKPVCAFHLESAERIDVAEDADCQVAFDGVLHNREQLAESLGSSARLLDSASLISRAFRRWNDDTLKRLRGEFAFVIWDRRGNALLCARDPMGMHPLYYTESGSALLFSSSVEALVRTMSSAPVNRVSVAAHLCHRWLNVHDTYYERIKRLPPGHALRWEGGRLQLFRYWHPGLVGEAIEWLDERDLEQFGCLLDQAVARCLKRGRPAIFLSGDSIP